MTEEGRTSGSAPAPANGALLEMCDIVKSYPGVQALRGVSLDVRAGEVHALVGENGAGKSTLMKILAGAERKDGGTIRMDGREVDLRDPLEASRLGITMIYQEFNLVPQLSVAENIFLGREPVRGLLRLVDWRRLHRDARDVLARLGLELDVKRRVAELSIAQQQMVEIAKALSRDSRLIVMDEPSATLTDRELEVLFRLIAALKQGGVAIVYISHRLEEIDRIGDRVTVLRDGDKIGTARVGEISRSEIIRMMVGRPLSQEFPPRQAAPGDVALEVSGLRREGSLRDVSFHVRHGEVLGIAGLVGAGRTEVARAVFGADPVDGGEVRLHGRLLSIRSPGDAIAVGIGLVTEDRKGQGLVLGRPVRENVSLASLKLLSRLFFVKRREEARCAETFVRDLKIRTPSIEAAVSNLSGGNQQKVVLSRWLLTQSKVLFFDEPTRGIDVGAKLEIYQIINDLASRGVAIVMISSELPEILGMSDRILVMRKGAVAGVLDRAEATPERIMRLATGVE